MASLFKNKENKKERDFNSIHHDTTMCGKTKDDFIFLARASFFEAVTI